MKKIIHYLLLSSFLLFVIAPVSAQDKDKHKEKREKHKDKADKEKHKAHKEHMKVKNKSTKRKTKTDLTFVSPTTLGLILIPVEIT